MSGIWVCGLAHRRKVNVCVSWARHGDLDRRLSFSNGTPRNWSTHQSLAGILKEQIMNVTLSPPLQCTHQGVAT